MRIHVSAALVAAACFVAACDRTPTAPAASATAPALVKNGTLDGDRHPAVVLIIMDEGGAPAYRCSGTLIAPKVVLTAGHCTGEEGEFTGMRVFTEADVQNGDNNYPYGDGNNTVEATDWHTLPGYTSAQFARYDAGVIELKDAVPLPAGKAYGKLPAANSLDALQPRASTTFTAVGYGLQRINPAQVVAERVRMYAEPHLIQINGGIAGSYSLLLSNNASTGGTCFGDSGGPNYLGSGDVIAGVTSFGLNGTCGGTGGVFRIDRPEVLAFINQYMPRR